MSSTQKNICCCCSKQDCYKSMTTEYFWRGRKEVYGNMLESVLNIRMPVELQSHSICEVCIQNLRQASDFKEQVLQVQAALVNQVCEINDTKINIDVMDIEAENSEETKEPNLEIDVRVERMSDGDDYKETDAFDDTAPELLEDAKEVTKVSTKFNLKRRITKVTKAVDKERGIDLLTNTETNIPNDKWERERNLKNNTVNMLKHSNVCPFKWHKNKYQCFCCKITFTDITPLRLHTKGHPDNEIRKVVMRYNSVLFHKVDISSLKCQICSEPQDSLKSLRNHLIDIHCLKFESEEDLFIPFKLENGFKCAVCDENFRVFHNLNIHMNKHYQNHLCKTCGAGFTRQSNLREHALRHSVTCYTCEKCNIEFANTYQKERHNASVHKSLAKRVCPHCTERFSSHYSRLLHMINTHGLKKPEFKCFSCDRVFLRQYMLNCHVRKFHMKENKHECSVCQNNFFNKHDLRQHMVSHTGEKNFLCSICGKCYSRKSTLKSHMKCHVNLTT